MEERGVVAGVIEWASAARTLQGELASGDLAFVAPRAEGALVAVVDALGHGAEAAQDARIAAAALATDPDAALPELFARCDAALAGRRGVVMTAAVIGVDGRVQWAGIGDVEASLVRAADARRGSLVLRGGMLGDGRPAPRARVAETTLHPGDLVCFATDGVQPGFAELAVPAADVATNAALLLQRAARGDDDALVVVARFTSAGRRPA